MFEVFMFMMCIYAYWRGYQTGKNENLKPDVVPISKKDIIEENSN